MPCSAAIARALDVDAPAGELGGETGVLTLLADGKRELVVGSDDRRGVRVLVDDDAVDLGRRERRGDVGRGVLVPRHDVDALAAKLADDHAHAAALGADAGADRVEARLAARDGDLAAGARLARDALDLDDAVVDLGHLDLEEAADEAGVRARHDDRRLGALALAHVDDVGLDALVVVVALVAGLLGRRQQRLDALAQLDERVAAVALLHRAGHALADAVGVLLEDPLALGVADDRR